MKKYLTLAIILGVFTGYPAGLKADFRTSKSGQIYSNSRTVRFVPEVKFGKVISPAKVKKIELFVSTNKGKTWNKASEVDAEGKMFEFTAKNDGRHLFATVATDEVGQKEKMPMDANDANLDVIIDTVVPILNLNFKDLVRDVSPGDLRKVTWKNRDASPVKYIKVESYEPLTRSWSRRANIAGQNHYNMQIPNLGSTEHYIVRFASVDEAGNSSVWQQFKFILGPLIVNPVTSISGPSAVRQGKVIKLNLSSEGLTEEEFSHYEVYYTQNEGQSWLRAAATTKSEVEWKAPRDGRYGFFLSCRQKRW